MNSRLRTKSVGTTSQISIYLSIHPSTIYIPFHERVLSIPPQEVEVEVSSERAHKTDKMLWSNRGVVVVMCKVIKGGRR